MEDIPELQHLGYVDDYYASFEWSDGGLFHAHMAFWVVGAPRIDKVTLARPSVHAGTEIEVQLEDNLVLPEAEAAGRMASFWDRVITEYNVAKALCTEDDSGGVDSGGATDTTLRGDIGPRAKCGKKAEKEKASPETLSYRSFAHCLLGGPEQCSAVEEKECWDELENILRGCARASASWEDYERDRKPKEQDTVPPGSGSEDERRAFARKVFVSALAEWVNMHDLHKPFALGPPSKDQPCASVDNEHSTQERTSCNKLFPRKCIEPGDEEIAEDPRRRELYRLWLARNCHFINNYVPIVLLALLANMDFQATLTKEAVIEYMTKYMTKSGQASLIKVMEHSFSLCIEKAREQEQGSGSAVIRWFNLQSITEAKSQLETMHLLFAAPRYISSREFRDIYLRSEARQAKSKEQIEHAESGQEPIAGKSAAETYIRRDSWELPTRHALQGQHALTRQPLWREVLKTVQVPVSDSTTLDEAFPIVSEKWGEYVHLLSWWQFKRYFKVSGRSVVCKPYPDIVVVHPAGRFTTAKTEDQRLDACRWTLLAFCNHGRGDDHVFRDLPHLESFEPERVLELAELFITASPAERVERTLTQCPPHVRHNWDLGEARQRHMEERKLSPGRVAAAMPKLTFRFEADDVDWTKKTHEEMDAAQQALAKEAWREAEEAENLEADAGAELAEDIVIRSRMRHFMQAQLKWSHRELHDELLAAGLVIPARPSLVNYFTTLRLQFGDCQTGFLPQSFQSHTKKRMQEILRILGRRGANRAPRTVAQPVSRGRQ